MTLEGIPDEPGAATIIVPIVQEQADDRLTSQSFDRTDIIADDPDDAMAAAVSQGLSTDDLVAVKIVEPKTLELEDKEEGRWVVYAREREEQGGLSEMREQITARRVTPGVRQAYYERLGKKPSPPPQPSPEQTVQEPQQEPQEPAPAAALGPSPEPTGVVRRTYAAPKGTFEERSGGSKKERAAAVAKRIQDIKGMSTTEAVTRLDEIRQKRHLTGSTGFTPPSDIYQHYPNALALFEALDDFTRMSMAILASDIKDEEDREWPALVSNYEESVRRRFGKLLPDEIVGLDVNNKHELLDHMNIVVDYIKEIMVGCSCSAAPTKFKSDLDRVNEVLMRLDREEMLNLGPVRDAIADGMPSGFISAMREVARTRGLRYSDDRLRKGIQLFKDQMVWETGLPDTYGVYSQEGDSYNPSNWYMVSLDVRGVTCTCPDYKFQRSLCKHLIAAFARGWQCDCRRVLASHDSYGTTLTIGERPTPLSEPVDPIEFGGDADEF